MDKTFLQVGEVIIATAHIHAVWSRTTTDGVHHVDVDMGDEEALFFHGATADLVWNWARAALHTHVLLAAPSPLTIVAPATARAGEPASDERPFPFSLVEKE